jgi:hypothetical protein
VLTLVMARAACAGGLAEQVPPYKPMEVVFLLQNEKAKQALNIVSYQEAGIKAAVGKYLVKQNQDAGVIIKMQEPDREARVRALTARRADELFQSLSRVLSPAQLKRLKQILLQGWGIAVFDYPEIREALKLSVQDAERLKEIHEQRRKDLLKQVQEGKLPRDAGYQEYNSMVLGVSDWVRAALTEQQRQILNDLLGPPYSYF